MEVKNNHSENIRENLDYLNSKYLPILKAYGADYEVQLENKVKSLAFDVNDVEEVLMHLKKIYGELNEEMVYSAHGEINAEVFNWITMANDQITLSEVEIKKKTESLRNSSFSFERYIHELDGIRYNAFMAHAKHTVRLLVLKNYASQFKRHTENRYPFLDDGYDWFLKFEDRFNEEKGLTVKYTLIFEFLVAKKLILDNFEQFRTFVLENCSDKLKDVKFSRRADTTGKNTSTLTAIYRRE